MLAALFGDGIFGMMARIKMKVFRQGAAIDHFPGYPVVRAWFPWEAVPFAVSRLKPDVAVVQCHKSVPLGQSAGARPMFRSSSISGTSNSMSWAAICRN